MFQVFFFIEARNMIKQTITSSYLEVSMIGLKYVSFNISVFKCMIKFSCRAIKIFLSKKVKINLSDGYNFKIKL